MRILFFSLPPFGHVLPMVPPARAFLDAGHEVMAEEVVAVPSPAEVAAGLSALDQNGHLRA
jgi:hypothetical protein